MANEGKSSRAEAGELVCDALTKAGITPGSVVDSARLVQLLEKGDPTVGNQEIDLRKQKLVRGIVTVLTQGREMTADDLASIARDLAAAPTVGNLRWRVEDTIDSLKARK